MKDLNTSNNEKYKKSIYNTNAFVSSHQINSYDSGILNNLTFAVKDNIDISNTVTGYGSPCWKNSHPSAVSHAICVEQLLAEGATCIGKTISDELAYSLLGINPFYGTPLNPKAPDRVPGGSSSGSASAVASGLVDFALGTDTAGSIRVPASNCGVWGYRPSHGAISNSGVAALAPSFDTVGIIAKNGKIMRLTINALLGNTAAINIHSPTIYIISDVIELCDTDVKDAFTASISEIANHWITKPASLYEIVDERVDCNWLFEHSAYFMSAEIWNTFGSWKTNGPSNLSPATQFNLENYAKNTDRIEVQKWIRARRLFSTKLNNFLAKGNLLCFPTTPALAPLIEEITDEFLRDGDYYPRSMGINALSGLSATPQITIPVAQSNGVPIGLSFVAGYGQDILLANFCETLSNKIM